MMQLIRAVLDRWAFFALGSAALMLAIAHAFETFGGYAPCTLCLRAREVYWVAGTVALACILAVKLPKILRWRWLFHVALALVFAVGVGVAVYHSGAEWKWWPGPTTCASTGGGVSAQAMSDLLGGAKIQPPACDEAAWRLLGLSMAGWNALVSLKLTIFSAWAALRDRPRS
ncbi:disulfide bond formation protein B [Phenylobacterium sp.]|uniref:disulfide bond formation protein B n=1 Tax=Phenylobacterium sp. TaxID=1871053 RepID=UPI00286D81DA|nr:disulfide bond formation protein B [Phenylobacterium sp.]